MAGLADSAVVAVPLAVMIACVAAVERHRGRRRRAALNRALHELRRPLQFLALIRSAPAPERGPAGASAAGQLDAALAALADLDAAINGRRAPAVRRRVRADELVGAAVERWRWPATLLGRELDLRWMAGEAALLADAPALSQALDNLVANSLEHGAGRVRLEGTAEAGRLRIAVVDDLGPGGGPGTLAGPLVPGPRRNVEARRGHGLAHCAGIASAHGGRLALFRGRRGTRAVLDLPLAPRTVPQQARELPPLAA